MQDFSFGVIPIYNKNGVPMFLLIQHQHEYGGHWAFPKGHMEEGETEREAALRELKEESGVEDVVLDEKIEILEKYSFVQDEKQINKTVKYFLGFVNKEDVDTSKGEIHDAIWLTYEEALSKITFLEGKNTLKLALQALQDKENIT